MRGLSILLVLLALAGAGGCGDDDGRGGETGPARETTEAAPPPPSEREWAAEAKPICRKYGDRADDALVRANPNLSDDIRVNGRALRAQYPVFRQQVRKLRALPEPRPVENVRRFLKSLEAAVELVPDAARGMATLDTALGARTDRRYARLRPRLESLARRLRVRGCIPESVAELVSPG